KSTGFVWRYWGRTSDPQLVDPAATLTSISVRCRVVPNLRAFSLAGPSARRRKPETARTAFASRSRTGQALQIVFLTENIWPKDPRERTAGPSGQRHL